MATTARTASLDTTERLAGRRSTTSAGASTRPAAIRRSVDIAFSNPAGGDPSRDAFDADAHLEGLAELPRLGVTWVQVGLPGDSVEHAVEVAQRYGEQVIAVADPSTSLVAVSRRGSIVLIAGPPGAESPSPPALFERVRPPAHRRLPGLDRAWLRRAVAMPSRSSRTR